MVVDEIRAFGGEAEANSDDIASSDGAQNLVNSAVDAFGGLHVLVNNAGILRDRMLVNMSEEDWDSVIHVHLKGHFLPTRYAAGYWREQVKQGRDVERVGHQHVVDVGPARATRARRTTGRPRRGSARSPSSPRRS